MKHSILSMIILVATLCLTSCEEELVTNKTYALEEELSTVEWKGFSPSTYHDGSFQVTSRNIQVFGGKLRSGTFIIPIISIKNFDLPEEVKPVLLNHLKSADFFNMIQYPTASFKITKVIASPVPTASSNYIMTGDFTMLGQTHSVTFPAMIQFEGNELKVNANFEIDRTKWGMNYAADPALGEHHILPIVDIKLNLLAHPI